MMALEQLLTAYRENPLAPRLVKDAMDLLVALRRSSTGWTTLDCGCFDASVTMSWANALAHVLEHLGVDVALEQALIDLKRLRTNDLRKRRAAIRRGVVPP